MRTLIIGCIALLASVAAYAQTPTQNQINRQQNNQLNQQLGNNQLNMNQNNNGNSLQPRSNSLNRRDTVGGRTLINDYPNGTRVNPAIRNNTVPQPGAPLGNPVTPSLPGNPPTGMPNNPGNNISNPNNSLQNRR